MVLRPAFLPILTISSASAKASSLLFPFSPASRNIDGIINNGPKQPTVTELEEQVKAGFSISLMELAAASRREGQEKKKSVLEQLKAKAQEPPAAKTAPKRSAEREL